MNQERQNIALIGSIDLLQEIGTKSTLTHLGDSLLERRNGGETFSPYETLVLDRYESVLTLGQCENVDAMLQIHDGLRTRTVNIFDALRASNSVFKLFAHLGERPSTCKHVIDKFSFSTPDCVRDCILLYGENAGNMLSPNNKCVKYKGSPILHSIFTDGGTILSKEDARQVYNNNANQSDFYLFSSTGNNETSLMKDIETLRICTGSSLSEEDFGLLVALDSMSDTAQRVAIYYAANGTPSFLVNWSSRNYEMGYDCKKEMFTSPNSIVTVSFLNHTNHSMKGGLKKCGEDEVKRLAGEYAALAQQFNGILLQNGSIVNAEEGMASWCLRKAGLMGGPNALERELEREAAKKMSADQSKGAARYYELVSTSDLTDEEILDRIGEEIDIATKNHVKACVVDRADLYVEYKKLKMTNTNLSDEDIFTVLRNTKKYSKGSIKWLISTVRNTKVRQLASAKRSDKALSSEMLEQQAEMEALHGEEEVAKRVQNQQDGWDRGTDLKQLASAMRDGPLSSEMLKLRSELETVYTKQGLEDILKNFHDGYDRATDLKRYASAVNSGKPLSAEMKKTKAKLETIHGGKKGLEDKVKGINTGFKSMKDTKAQQVHDRNIKELGMSMAKSGETVPQFCPNCKREQESAYVFNDDGDLKIVLDTCLDTCTTVSKRNGKNKCFHKMQVKPDIKAPLKTISRNAIECRIKKLKKSSSVVVSSSDESSSSGVDTVVQIPRVYTSLPLFTIASESVVDPEAGMRVAMKFNNGNYYSGTIINIHPVHSIQPNVRRLAVTIWLDDNTMEQYVEYPNVDIRFFRSPSLSIAFNRELFPLDTEIAHSSEVSEDGKFDSSSEASSIAIVETQESSTVTTSNSADTDNVGNRVGSSSDKSADEIVTHKPPTDSATSSRPPVKQQKWSTNQNEGQLKRSAKSALPWQCPKCTFLNDTTAIECICGYKFREAKKSR